MTDPNEAAALADLNRLVNEPTTLGIDKLMAWRKRHPPVTLCDKCNEGHGFGLPCPKYQNHSAPVTFQKGIEEIETGGSTSGVVKPEKAHQKIWPCEHIGMVGGFWRLIDLRPPNTMAGSAREETQMTPTPDEAVPMTQKELEDLFLVYQVTEFVNGPSEYQKMTMRLLCTIRADRQRIAALEAAGDELAHHVRDHKFGLGWNGAQRLEAWRAIRGGKGE